MAGRVPRERAMSRLADVIEPNGLDHAGGHIKDHYTSCDGKGPWTGYSSQDANAGGPWQLFPVRAWQLAS